MKEIILYSGNIATVDDEDYEWASQYKWYERREKSHSTTYAQRTTARSETNGIREGWLLHRKLMERALDRLLLTEEQIDHRDGDGLNNTRDNMRIASNRQNGCNRVNQRPNSTTGLRGVSHQTKSGEYVARIVVNQRLVTLGTYASPVDAAKQYDQAAHFYHKEFACLNYSDIPRDLNWLPPLYIKVNTPRLAANKSPYRGVSWSRKYKYWVSRHKRIHLGVFTNDKEAALAYDKARYDLTGDLAKLNFPERFVCYG